MSAPVTKERRPDGAALVIAALVWGRLIEPLWLNLRHRFEVAEVVGEGTNTFSIYIDGKEMSQYTFKQNYYFMMGDNRHNSLDSRYWGFVPEDHIVGKAFFIWLSIDKEADFFDKIRWNRFFKLIE